MKTIHNGIVSHIQNMSINDGEGLRTTVFLKGCDLRCKWCHNPETFLPRPQLEWIHNRCIGCGICLENCPKKALSLNNGVIHRNDIDCISCGECVENCYAGAHHRIGEIYNVDQLSNKLEQDITIYKVSDGGVTISGGEPMVQFDFVLQLVKKLKEKHINICIQTNLNAPWDKYQELLPYIDYWMCDFKHIDNIAHRYWTGQDNHNILKNISLLDAWIRKPSGYCLRTPVVPGVNDDETVLQQMSNFVSRLKNVERYELIPFHPLASYKYKSLNMHYYFDNVKGMNTERFNILKSKFELYTK